MNTFFQVTLADFRESVRAKWFLIYSLVFGGAVILLFVLGVTEARVMGFTGLSRLLITYIQLCVAILPILILISECDWQNVKWKLKILIVRRQ